MRKDPTARRAALLLALSTLAATAVLTLSGCGGGSAAAPEAAPEVQAEAPRPQPQPQPPAPPASAASAAAARVALGDALFHEPRLSASGRQACASCHAPGNAHADPAGGFLPLGGERLDQQGLRSSPSVRYLDQAGAFRFNAQGQPVGGLMWDGRESSRVAQAAGPLFNAKEMANASVADFAARLRATPHWQAMLAAYGLSATATDAQLLAATQDALALYQAQDADFHPFSSQFDRVQAGQAQFSAAEQRGLALFNDPQRGNCASCHSSRPGNGPNAAPAALFTDFSYRALGVPRNRSEATADAGFFDLGLCGPTRTDLASRSDLCGRFKVPSLRNVALTAPYFHNGRFNTLEEVVAFYATRDTDPARWYPVVGGQVQRFNDLPAAYQGNVERGAPFAPLPGNRPRLSAQDVSDVVAFLRTLTDADAPAR